MNTFKRAKVIKLPTPNGGAICINNKDKMFNSHYSDTKNYHLYIISDDEVNEGDYYLWNSIGGWELIKAINLFGFHESVKHKVFKVISTTDKLNIHPNISDSYRTGNCLPQPSQQFIEKYIEEYNNGNIITDVLVEYEEYYPNLVDGDFTRNNILRINPKDNTITIKKLKTNWDKNEITNIIKKFADVFVANTNTAYKQKDINDWIENNL